MLHACYRINRKELWLTYPWKMKQSQPRLISWLQPHAIGRMIRIHRMCLTHWKLVHNREFYADVRAGNQNICISQNVWGGQSIPNLPLTWMETNNIGLESTTGRIGVRFFLFWIRKSSCAITNGVQNLAPLAKRNRHFLLFGSAYEKICRKWAIFDIFGYTSDRHCFFVNGPLWPIQNPLIFGQLILVPALWACHQKPVRHGEADAPGLRLRFQQSGRDGVGESIVLRGFGAIGSSNSAMIENAIQIYDRALVFLIYWIEASNKTHSYKQS